jgi:hypothetical protein
VTELGGTPWVDRNITTAWKRIAARVPATWMPLAEVGTKVHVQELGCGHYGCVMPTSDPDIVCKLTTDATEAAFIARAMTMDSVEGIVKYHDIYAIDGATHKGRQLFITWRSAADTSGILISEQHSKDDYSRRSAKEGAKLLGQFQDKAAIVRKTLLPKLQEDLAEEWLTGLWANFEQANPEASLQHQRAQVKAAIALRQCYVLAQEIANTYLVDAIGNTLEYYIDNGLLLADIHLNNIGRDSSTEQIIITDPGHCVVVHPQWAYPPEIGAI